MKKSMQFLLLILFMLILNILGYIIGMLFIHDFSQYEKFDFFPSLFFVTIFSFFQIFVFPIKKKYREYFIPICTLFLFFLHDDTSGYGGEFVYMISTATSKIIAFLTFLGTNIETDSIRYYFMNILHSIGFSCYLFIVFYVFKHFLNHFEKKTLLNPNNNRR